MVQFLFSISTYILGRPSNPREHAKMIIWNDFDPIATTLPHLLYLVRVGANTSYIQLNEFNVDRRSRYTEARKFDELKYNSKDIQLQF